MGLDSINLLQITKKDQSIDQLIDQLFNLSKFYLSGNQITEIMGLDSISNDMDKRIRPIFYQLQALNLSYNQMAEIKEVNISNLY